MRQSPSKVVAKVVAHVLMATAVTSIACSQSLTSPTEAGVASVRRKKGDAMWSRLLHTLGVFGVVLSLVVPAQLYAQKKGDGKPPTSTSKPGTAVFRNAAGDRIIGTHFSNGSPDSYKGTGSPETGEGAHLTSNNELWLGVGSGGYQVTLDFTGLVGPLPCLPNCRQNRPGMEFPVVYLDSEDAEFQSNVLAPGSQEPTANGLLDVPLTDPPSTWSARLKINFSDPLGEPILWTLWFSDEINYAGTTDIDVTRTGQCTWAFETDENDRGGLVAMARGGPKSSQRTDEGLYRMPFQLTFHVENCMP